MSERTKDTETIYNGIVTRPHQSNPKPFYTVTTVLISPYTVIKHILFRLLLSMNIHSKPYIHYLTLNDQNRPTYWMFRHVLPQSGRLRDPEPLDVNRKFPYKNFHTIIKSPDQSSLERKTPKERLHKLVESHLAINF